MSDRRHILVAMSGGVDSSVAAGLLIEQGHRITGIYMRTRPVITSEGADSADGGTEPVNSALFGEYGELSPAERDSWGADARDAQAVAEQLGIRLLVVDYRAAMGEIVDYFLAAYRAGRTPNPCIMCNMRLKWGRLFHVAEAIRADGLATGHYARLEPLQRRWRLLRAVDRDKDQSYALFGIPRDRLDRVVLPNGRCHKQCIRELAQQMALPVHDKGDSQEICFIPDDDYVSFLRERAPELMRRGTVVHTDGRELGEHEGVFQFTIGQRRGLGIALGEPAYVVKLDAGTNTVVLGDRQALLKQRFVVRDCCWHEDVTAGETFHALVQIRYNHPGAGAVVRPITLREEGAAIRPAGGCDAAEVIFDDPIQAITPGQAAVFYSEQDVVIGGGWIDHVVQ